LQTKQKQEPRNLTINGKITETNDKAVVGVNMTTVYVAEERNIY